ncbi:MAG: hypothetical protein BWY39_00180 [Spirochaetes bacterium ADurb.Bin269]|nr:MAG: hypothetical protein BWY39_00180 [Spirochaetes bacterium ADurb.Bin269]
MGKKERAEAFARAETFAFVDGDADVFERNSCKACVRIVFNKQRDEGGFWLDDCMPEFFQKREHGTVGAGGRVGTAAGRDNEHPRTVRLAGSGYGKEAGGVDASVRGNIRYRRRALEGKTVIGSRTKERVQDVAAA